eukprot:scaffold377342_cov28-Attheya_sp.AAC.1
MQLHASVFYAPLLAILSLRFFTCGGVVNAVVIIPSPDFHYASANADNGGVILVNDYSWPSHRFEVVGSTTTLSSVGGFFGNFGSPSPTTVFAAITSLTSMRDYPNSIDLVSTDVISTTTFDIPVTELNHEDITTSLVISLEPGWYSLTFGTNAFGAPSNVGSHVTMTGVRSDLDQDHHAFSISKADGFIELNTLHLRFLVNGRTRTVVTGFDFSTARGDPTNERMTLSANEWPSHRFEVVNHAMMTLSSVGGLFENNSTSPTTVFAAIGVLSSESDFPFTTLTTAYVVAIEPFNIPPTSHQGIEITIPLSMTLTPGWYSLTFGINAHGESSENKLEAHITMVCLSADLDQQLPFTIFKSENFIRQVDAFPQFLVNGSQTTLVRTGLDRILWQFERLEAGSSYQSIQASVNGVNKCTAIMQRDGNFLTKINPTRNSGDGKTMWKTDPVSPVIPNADYFITMQTDGNLVIYDRNSAGAKYSTHTYHDVGSIFSLAFDADCSLGIFNYYERQEWSNIRTKLVAYRWYGKIGLLGDGEILRFPERRAFMRIQRGTGNLIVREGSDLSNAGKVLWNAGVRSNATDFFLRTNMAT